MNKEIKERWLSALRSGEYAQGCGALKDSNEFCCLGVLCDLYIKDGNDAEWSEGFMDEWSEGFMEDGVGYNEELPNSVVEWAGLDDNNPMIIIDNGDRVNISKANDGYPGSEHRGEVQVLSHSFEQVADIIEKQL